MRVIHKYPYDLISNEMTVVLSEGATVRLFGGQNALPQSHVALWIETDDNLPLKQRRFKVFPTGVFIPDGAIHMASCIVEPFVWHLYDITNIAE